MQKDTIVDSIKAAKEAIGENEVVLPGYEGYLNENSGARPGGYLQDLKLSCCAIASYSGLPFDDPNYYVRVPLGEKNEPCRYCKKDENGKPTGISMYAYTAKTPCGYCRGTKHFPQVKRWIAIKPDYSQIEQTLLKATKGPQGTLTILREDQQAGAIAKLLELGWKKLATCHGNHGDYKLVLMGERFTPLGEPEAKKKLPSLKTGVVKTRRTAVKK